MIYALKIQLIDSVINKFLEESPFGLYSLGGLIVPFLLGFLTVASFRLGVLCWSSETNFLLFLTVSLHCWQRHFIYYLVEVGGVFNSTQAWDGLFLFLRWGTNFITVVEETGLQLIQRRQGR